VVVLSLVVPVSLVVLVSVALALVSVALALVSVALALVSVEASTVVSASVEPLIVSLASASVEPLIVSLALADDSLAVVLPSISSLDPVLVSATESASLMSSLQAASMLADASTPSSRSEMEMRCVEAMILIACSRVVSNGSESNGSPSSGLHGADGSPT
jgi:hypothetical protein